MSLSFKRKRKFGLASIGVALVAAAMVVPFVPAHARLSAAGPADEASGMPSFYRDRTGLQLKVCEGAACGEVDPTAPVYWSAEAEVPTRGKLTATLVMGVEGEYFNGTVNPAEAQVLATILVKAKGLRPNQTYRFVYPYGTLKAIADNNGRIRNFIVDEVGCHPEDPEPGQQVEECNFNSALRTKIGPFLQWDPRVRKAPAGFVGHAEAARPVIGSPLGTNYFKVSGPGLGTRRNRSEKTKRFFVTGQKGGRDTIAPTVRVRSRTLRLSASKPVSIISRISESARVDVQVKKAGRVIRSYRTKRVWGPSTLELSWNGKNSAGKTVRPGKYRLMVKATDAARNVGVSRTATVAVTR